MGTTMAPRRHPAKMVSTISRLLCMSTASRVPTVTPLVAWRHGREFRLNVNGAVIDFGGAVFSVGLREQ